MYTTGITLAMPLFSGLYLVFFHLLSPSPDISTGIINISCGNVLSYALALL